MEGNYHEERNHRHNLGGDPFLDIQGMRPASGNILVQRCNRDSSGGLDQVGWGDHQLLGRPRDSNVLHFNEVRIC